MMDEESNAGAVTGDTTETIAIEGIKYADPHKLAFFDLLVDVTDADNLKLIHGDFETVKKKIFNHEYVIGAIIGCMREEDDSLKKPICIGTGTTLATNIVWNMLDDEHIAMKWRSSGGISMEISLLPDNTITLRQDGSGFDH